VKPGRFIPVCKVADTGRCRNCHALSQLLHVFSDEPGYIAAGYQLDKGNTDELSQGRVLVNESVKAAGAGVMQLLIVDRGYIDGVFISDLKKQFKVDVMVPLKVSLMSIKSNDTILRYWGLDTTYKPSSQLQAFDTYTSNVPVLKSVICNSNNHGISAARHRNHHKRKTPGCIKYSLCHFVVSESQ